MSSRPDSTPPPAPPTATAVSSTFRRTFTWRFYNPAHVEALERVGDILWEFLNETHQFGPPEVDDQPVVVGELRAVCGELLATASYLDDMTQDSFGTAPTPAERRLEQRAAGWAKRVRKVMASIEEAVSE